MRLLPGVHAGGERARDEACGGRARRARSQKRVISLSVAGGEQDGGAGGEHGGQGEEPEEPNSPHRLAWRPYAAPEEPSLGHVGQRHGTTLGKLQKKKISSSKISSSRPTRWAPPSGDSKLRFPSKKTLLP